jgi:hypothetical protein
MTPVVGTFKSRLAAERVAAELGPLEVPRDKINILTPEMSAKELATVPTVAGEQPGIGKAMGAVVGGAMGIAGGGGIVPALVGLVVPGVGPVLGMGILAGILLGAIGAVGGAALGEKLETDLFKGIPEDELFIYQDALRKGRTVVVVMAEDDEANAVRGALEVAGAETIDRAREMWWLGLRDVEKEKYSVEGGNFDHDERDFRAGFEAALQLRNRNRPWDECYRELTERDKRVYENEAFRHGYERGLQYLEVFRKHAKSETSVSNE